MGAARDDRARDDRRSAAGTLILALGPVTWAVLMLSTSAPIPPADAKMPPSSSLRVLLVRHGMADRDSLTWRGIAEARATGQALKQKEIVAVIASPARRTQQTASIIVQELGRPVVVAEDDAFMVKRGESIEHATVRALVALRVLTERYAGGTVVIVTHFNVCAALLRHAAGNPKATPCPRHELGAPSITEITVLPGGVLTLDPAPLGTSRPAPGPMGTALRSQLQASVDVEIEAGHEVAPVGVMHLLQ